MVGIIIGILLAALVYWISLVLGLPTIIAIIAAVLVLLSAIGTGGYGFGGGGGGGHGRGFGRGRGI